METQKTFVILDSNALVHRAWHALPPLATKSGELVNAIYGFLLIFFKVIKDVKPDYVAATFDLKGPTFRHKEFAEYKAQRVKKPDELYAQIPKIKELLTAFGVPIFEKEGFEADDVIGTITAKVRCQVSDVRCPIETVIVTGDMDTLQLVDEHTKVLSLKKGISETVLYDVDAVKTRFGLTPEQMIDYKALRGDPSDNIPGVAGVGEKTATELLKEFGSIEGILHEVKKCLEAQEAKLLAPRAVERSLASDPSRSLASDVCPLPEKTVKKFEGAEKQIEQSKRLVTIVRNVPVKFDLADCTWGKIDREAVLAKFQQYEFQSLVSKIPNTNHRHPEPVEGSRLNERRDPSTPLGFAQDDIGNYRLITTDEQFTEFLEKLKKEKAFVVDIETTGLDPFHARIIGASFCWKDGEAFYVDLTGSPSTSSGHINLSAERSRSPSKEHWLAQLKPILENPKVEKYGHNAKYDVEVFQHAGITLSPVTFDTMIASYLLNPGSRQHNLEQVVFNTLGKELTPITELIGSGSKQLTMDAVTPERVAEYSSTQADYTWQLVSTLKKELEKTNLLHLFEKIEMPLVPVLARMETHGVKVDIVHLEKLSKEVGSQLQTLEKKIIKLAGTEFNVSSPSQLKEVLFEKLALETKGIGKTKTGLSTAAEELEKLKDAHPIIPLVLEHRELSKLKNTYLDALPLLLNPDTGRVHTSFNQTVAATGRLSSSNPNLQNIPVRTELGNEVRNAFVAESGMTFLSLDYSQIELRIVASIANDKKMIAAFEAYADIHAATAAEVYGVPLADVTRQQRRNAKTINFGVLYGLGHVGLAQQTGMSREEARGFIEQYFTVYDGVAAYVEETKALAATLGYVETLLGRRRYLPEITSGMQQIRAAAERMAVNMPVQGTAADLMKLAMIEVDKELPKLSATAKMLLQVHDSLLIELPPEDCERAAKRVRDIMTGIYKLRVPIEVHVEEGKRWGSMKRIPNV